MKEAKNFKAAFKRPLHDFWINNVRGFDIQRFCDEMLEACHGSLVKAVRAEYGDEKAALIKRLVPSGSSVMWPQAT